MDFGRVRQHGAAGEPDVVEVIFSTHQAGPDDGSPLHMISAARLAQLELIERAAVALAAALPAVQQQDPAPEQSSGR